MINNPELIEQIKKQIKKLPPELLDKILKDCEEVKDVHIKK